jgi:hypothetical protein
LGSSKPKGWRSNISLGRKAIASHAFFKISRTSLVESSLQHFFTLTDIVKGKKKQRKNKKDKNS